MGTLARTHSIKGFIMRKEKTIVVSSTDRDRLLTLIDSVRLDRRIAMDHIIALENELARAVVVAPNELPSDVISMNSIVWIRDLDTNEIERYMLVHPHEADVMQDRISILAPVGTALLGYRLHDSVQWRVPQGTRRFEIIKVSQPASIDEADAQELLTS